MSRKIAEKLNENGRTGYVCACGARNQFNMYAVAQMAMGHALVHTCDCSRKNDVLPGGRVLLSDPAAAALPASSPGKSDPHTGESE